MVFRRRALVSAVALLGIAQQLRERLDIHADAAPGQSRADFLQEPAVAIGIGHRGERSVALTIRLGALQPIARGARTKLGAGRCGVEYVADLGSAANEFLACTVDVRNDKVDVLR